MIYALNYADENFKQQQQLNTKSAMKNGFKKVFEYGPLDLDKDFKNKNKNILNQKRGGGYWLWKPYIVLKALKELEEGDYAFYCDSGAIYLNNPNELIHYMEANNLDILPFELPLLEKQWTKRETFQLLKAESKKYTDTNQILATYFVIKKTKRSLEFFQEFLRCAEIEDIISDVKYLEQDKVFIDHRHDQSIFSILCKKHNINPYIEPTQYGDYPWLYNNLNEYLFTKVSRKKINKKRIILSFRKDSILKVKFKLLILDILGESFFYCLRNMKKKLKK